MSLLNKKSRPMDRVSAASASQKPSPRYYSGSQRPAAASPFQRRPVAKTPKKRIFKRVRDIVIVAVIIIGLVYSLIIKPQAKVLVNDTSYHQAVAYQIAAESALKGLRNHTKLTLDQKGITAAMKREFPEIKSLKLDLSLFSQVPVFKFDIAAPTFDLNSNNKIYVVGSNGVVVSSSGQLPSLSKLPTVIDQSGFEASPGKQVLGTESIAFINTLLTQCKRAKVQVQSLTLPAAPQALELRATDSPYYVKFNLGGDALIQAGQYLAAKHKFDSEGGQPAQYLDVRVSGKIYYK